MDKISPESRSHVMSCIHSKNTKPELIVRKALHALGFRYRIHCKELPGSPDLVLPKYKAVIQINGCFWHGHNCHLYRPPKSKVDFWNQKITKNQTRDMSNKSHLINLGWRLMVVWECAIQGKTKLDTSVLISLIENWILVGNDFVELQGNNCQ